jgi:hypothetical protein
MRWVWRTILIHLSKAKYIVNNGNSKKFLAYFDCVHSLYDILWCIILIYSTMNIHPLSLHEKSTLSWTRQGRLHWYMGWAYTLQCNVLSSSYHFLCLHHVCYPITSTPLHICKLSTTWLPSATAWSLEQSGATCGGTLNILWDAHKRKTLSKVCWIIWPFTSEKDVLKYIMVHPKKLWVNKCVNNSLFSDSNMFKDV